MRSIVTKTPSETKSLGTALAKRLKGGDVVALYGGLGMGKTVFVKGLAAGLGLEDEVTSPTFALVHEYGRNSTIDGNPPLIHFDMYRVSGWDDLYSTGFFDYLDAGGILVVEWSENIEAALPENTIRVYFEKPNEDCRRIEIEGAEGVEF
ncbi:MAG: tRNA (adenosine(37)-N6)-threonylcarbamoyltransferase complex ATPase subunit type 1 TsaE [Oscillospiraceae bacterium]|nr:tRNA (adenosine(37)-N6)-threonylcarbamoyltransferase complex ATPase subunit type 1 TsaE [Oscillospiraceae bacterium]MDD4413169.1 tRNA (adenosine(37)-N6)-threonylcarbamoyltransferase complex ATPase subunit type 1 TsaE [Oscillospiraceae bacterium]